MNGAFDVHERAVVATEEQRRAQAATAEHSLQTRHDAASHGLKTGVDDGGVLPFEQTKPAHLAGYGHVAAGDGLGHEVGDLSLLIRVHRREDRGDGHGAVAGVGDAGADLANLLPVEPADRAAVELSAAMAEEPLCVHRRADALRPVGERRDRRRRGQTQANGGHAVEALGLNEGVHEVRRADHHRVDALGAIGPSVEQGRDGVLDPGRHVGGGPLFHGVHHACAI